MDENDNNEYPFENTYYTFWYRGLEEKSWDISSYKKLAEMHSLKDFWEIYNSISTFNNGMFFLMKEDILPIWEDEKNINGGCWAFRLSRKTIDKTWKELSIAFIGNTLMKELEMNKNINGISVVPKIYNCVLKIWNSDFEKKDILANMDSIDVKRCNYKKHK